MDWVQYLTLIERLILIAITAFVIISTVLLIWNGRLKTKFFAVSKPDNVAKVEKKVDKIDFSVDEISEKLSKSIFNAEEIVNFSNHRFFSRVDALIQMDLANLEVGNEFKRELFRDMLRIHWQTYKAVMEVEIENMAVVHDIYSLKYVASGAIIRASQEAEIAFIKQGIPEVVVKKYTERINLFDVFLLNLLEDLCHTSISKNQIIDLFLDCFVSTINTELVFLRHMFHNFNGELNGLEYRGIKYTKPE